MSRWTINMNLEQIAGVLELIKEAETIGGELCEFERRLVRLHERAVEEEACRLRSEMTGVIAQRDVVPALDSTDPRGR